MKIINKVIDNSAGDMQQQEEIYRIQLRSKWGYSVVDNTDINVKNWWHLDKIKKGIETDGYVVISDD